MNTGQYDKIKTHFHNNQKVYIAAGVGILVGAAGVLIFKQQTGNKATIDSWKLVNWKSPHTSQTIQINIPKPGNSGNMIRCLQNDTYYPSQRSLAKALDLNESQLSQHLQGKLPHVKGFTFEKVAENGIALAS